LTSRQTPHSSPGYVAATRFKRADDVIILQPFDIKIFQKGAPDQPQLLMRHLAGEDISDGLAALHKKIKEQTAAQQQQKKQRANQNRSETQKRNWEGMTAEERQRRAPKPQKQQRANENRSEKQKRSWEGMTAEERQHRAPKPAPRRWSAGRAGSTKPEDQKAIECTQTVSGTTQQNTGSRLNAFSARNISPARNAKYQKTATRTLPGIGKTATRKTLKMYDAKPVHNYTALSQIRFVPSRRAKTKKSNEIDNLVV
jgi:hypothetical protein